MKKKFLVFCMFLSSMFFGFVACDKDIYSDINISLVDDIGTVQLYIEDTKNNLGQVVEKSTSATFKVKVDCDEDVSPKVVVGDGKGYVGSTVKYLGDGISEITVNPLSKDYTGDFVLPVKTVFGNKSLSVDVKIDYKISDFKFNRNCEYLKAVAKGGTIDLNRLLHLGYTDNNRLVNFFPNKTTQTNLKFEIVTPGDEIYQNDDYFDKVGNKYRYDYDSTTDKDKNSYARIVDNSILETFETYQDESSNLKYCTYPEVSVDFAGEGSSEGFYQECIILKASYVGTDGKTIVDYFDISVIDDNVNVSFLMDRMKKSAVDDYFELDKIGNSLQYEIQMLNPSIISKINEEYYIKRKIKFDLTPESDKSHYNPDNYEIVIDYNGETRDSIIDAYDESVSIFSTHDKNSFDVESRKDGNFYCKFVLRHREYPNVIKKDIYVKFIVYSLPSTIRVNQTNDDKTYVVCDNYPNKSAEFKIELGSNEEILEHKFDKEKYYVAVSNYDEYDSNIVNLSKNMFLNGHSQSGNLNLFYVNKGNNLSYDEVNGKPYEFDNNSSFYLKHNFLNIPLRDTMVYVVVIVNLCPDSYSQNIKDLYFEEKYILYPIKIELAHSLDTFGIEKDNYYIDTSLDNKDGQLLFKLRQGQKFDEMIESLDYDKSLIDIVVKQETIEGIDAQDTIDAVYLKPVKNAKFGKTPLVIKAKGNGLSKTVNVELFRGSSYLNIDGLYNDMPLGSEIVSSSNTYLDYVTSASDIDGKINYSDMHLKNEFLGVYTKDPEMPDVKYEINSISKVFLNVGSSIDFKFYDYAVINGELVKFDITNVCNVYLDSMYASYSNGKLTIRKSLGNKPLSILVQYNARNLNQNYELSSITVQKNIEVYVYENFYNIGVTSLGFKDLYLQDYLGYFDKSIDSKDKYSYTLKTNFNSNMTELGTDWNDLEKWSSADGFEFVVGVSYDINLDRPIYGLDDKQLIFTAYKDKNVKYELKYSDFFSYENGEFVSKLSTSLLEFCNNPDNFYQNANTGLQQLRLFISKLNFEIVLVIPVKFTQFSIERVISFVNLKLILPTDNIEIQLFTDKDGLYFENRNGVQTKEIKYSLVGDKVSGNEILNKNLYVYSGSDTACYSVKLISNGLTGYIVIKSKENANYSSSFQIKLTTEDNIVGFDEGGKPIFRNNIDNLIKVIDVVFVDGSLEHPYQIKNTEDYTKMTNAVNSGKYAHYVIARDLDFSNYYDLKQIKFKDGISNEFSLSGNYFYNFNTVDGTKVINLKNKIYNLNINKTFEGNYNSNISIGLFEDLKSNIKLSDIYVEDVRININFKDDFTINSGRNIYIGSLFGYSIDSLNLYNVNVSGIMNISGLINNDNQSSIYIGSLFGYAKNGVIVGYENTINNKNINENENVNVYIDASKLFVNNNLYLGGYLGSFDGTVSNMQIVSNIKASNLSGYLGGAFGYINTIENVVVSSKVYVNHTASTSLLKNDSYIGGISGFANYIKDCKLLYVNVGSDKSVDDKLNMKIISGEDFSYSVGSVVGKLGKELLYTYVRSFYLEKISDSFKGNIYLDCNNKCVFGSLVGVMNGATISKSYFDGSVYNENNNNLDDNLTKSMKIYNFVGKIDSSSSISDSYIILKSNDNKINLNTSNVNLLNTYFVYNFDENTNYYINNILKNEVDFNNDLNAFDCLNRVTIESTSGNQNKNWFIDDNINNGYPILIKYIGDKYFALYDLIPTSISVNLGSALNNISYNGNKQIILFRDKEYIIEYGIDGSDFINVKLDSQSVISTKLVISMNDYIEYEIISLTGGMCLIGFDTNNDNKSGSINVGGVYRLIPITNGLCRIVLKSHLNKNVKTFIDIEIVDGFASFDINNNLETDSKILLGNDYFYEFITKNENGDVLPKNSDLGYIVKFNTGIININGIDLDFENNKYLIIEDSAFEVRPLEAGNIVLDIYPYIKINNLEYVYTFNNFISNQTVKFNNMYIFENRKKEIQFNCVKSAVSASVDIKNSELTSHSSFDFNLNIRTPNEDEIINFIDITIDGKENLIKSIGIDNNVFNYELLKIYCKSRKSTKIEGTDLYNLNICYNVAFDEKYYNKNADFIDLNHTKYKIKLKPETGSENVFDVLNITIKPNKINNIYMDYYPRIEEDSSELNKYTLPTSVVFSNSIIPASTGLLQVTFDEKINDSSYVVILIDKKYKDFISFEQLYGNLSAENNIEFYSGLEYKEDYSDYKHDFINFDNYDNYVGIKLKKLSVNNNIYTYFNNSYFIKFKTSKTLSMFKNIPILAVSCTLNENGNIFKTNTLDLIVKQLPLITVNFKNEIDANQSVIGLGVKKELNIVYKNLENDINYKISSLLGGDNLKDLLYIAYEENGKLIKVNNTIEIDKLNSGVKYYLCADTALKNCKDINIEFYSSQVIFGFEEICKYDMKNLKIVDYEIERIEIDDFTPINNDYLNLYAEVNRSQRHKFKVNIIYKNIEIGDKFEPKTKIEVENELSGFGCVKNIDFNYLYYCLSEDGQIYEKVDQLAEKSYGGILFNDKILEGVNCDNGDYQKYIEWYGYKVSDSNKFKFSFKFDYSNQVGKNDFYSLRILKNDDLSEISYIYEAKLDIRVKDNSTYDHPNPISSIEDLKNACDLGYGHYILVNNLTLNNWKPLVITENDDTKLDFSIDGNGYKLILNNFNFDEIRKNNQVDAGIFSVVTKNTLLKNIIVDISNMLIDEITYKNNISYLESSTIDSYISDPINRNIDLSFIKSLNFGVLAGVNYGSITNAKIVNTRNPKNTNSYYLQVLSNQINFDNFNFNSNIGGLVGLNESLGVITNSSLGLNVNGLDLNLINENSHELNELKSVEIYPFVIVGGNNISGFVSNNLGIIGNSYVKGVGLINVYPLVGGSKTAGFVITNEGNISNCAVEGVEKVGYRPFKDRYLIESKGNVSGFVYENNMNIDNSYSDVFIETRSAFSGGFVFVNRGTIVNAYSTIESKKSIAHGQFTGILESGMQNFGTYKNCYYIKSLNNSNVIDDGSIGINENSVNKYVWNGFVFNDSDDYGVWYYGLNKLPKLESLKTNTGSYRKIEKYDDAETETSYSYRYLGGNYELGSKNNPLIINNARNFIVYLIDNAKTINNKKVFGLYNSSVRHVRIVNNLDFKDSISSVSLTEKSADGTDVDKIYHLYDIVFAGVLDGCGLTFNNLNINTENTGTEDLDLNNFGLFAEIGYENSTALVKNLNINLTSFKSADAKRAGVLAGTIRNSSIFNININGNNKVENGLNTVVIKGRNLSGGLAGLIISSGDDVNSFKTNIKDINIKNIAVESTYNSIVNKINSSNSADVNVDGIYKKFKVGEGIAVTESEFNTLKDSNINYDNYDNLSYSGGVAGIIYVSKASDISNIKVSGSFNILNADSAGGLFGAVGKDTKIKNSIFELSENQKINALNFIGGLVGENYGYIEKCVVEHDILKQNEYDEMFKNDNGYRSAGSYDLFNSDNKVVAIGGLVGYSYSGSIINSYSRANVVNNKAFLAGGILGYAESATKTSNAGSVPTIISNVYSTGAVYSDEVIGGLIGFVLDDVNISNSVALTDWNASSELMNYRDIITKRFYDNYMRLFIDGSGGVVDFNIKMPEIGNLVLNDDSYNTIYAQNHNKYFTGSVFGKLKTVNKSQDKFINSAVFKSNHQDDLGVYSNTLGLYTRKGSLSQNTRNDSYNDYYFSLDVGLEKYRSIFSYDVVSGTTKDLINFNKIFSCQTYTEKLLGLYATTSEDNISRLSKNVFNYKYDENLIGHGVDDNQSVNNGIFVGGQGLKDWKMFGVFPRLISYIDNYIEISDIKDISKLNWNVGNYIIKKTTGTLSIKIDGKVSVGAKIIGDTDPKDSENKIEFKFYNVFESILPGAVFSNLKINIVNNNMPTGAKSNVAVFANSVNGALFEDCDFEINLKSMTSTDCFNLGYIFNTVKNSVFKNCTFNIKDDNEDKNNDNKDIVSNIETKENNLNFGLFAGVFDNSTLYNVKFNFNCKNNYEVLIGSSVNLNAGLIGYANNSTFDYVEIANSFNGENYYNLKVDYGFNHNVGCFVGFAKNSTLNNCKIDCSNFYINKVSASQNSNSTINNGLLNYGIMVGMAWNTFIYGGKTLGMIKINDAFCGLNVGGLVGYLKQSNIGNGLNSVGNLADINILSYGSNLNFGGVIGIIDSFSKLYNVYNLGDLNSIPNSSNDALNITNIGGLVGSSINGNLYIDSAVSNCKISNTRVSNSDNKYKDSIGGAIGKVDRGVFINNLTIINIISISNPETGSGVIGNSYSVHLLQLSNLFILSKQQNQLNGLNKRIIGKISTNNQLNGNIYYNSNIFDKFDSRDLKNKKLKSYDINELEKNNIQSDYYDLINNNIMEIVKVDNKYYIPIPKMLKSLKYSYNPSGEEVVK